MPAIDHPLIDRFLDALWLEKGLSDNTRQSYRSDLALFNGWLLERNLELSHAISSCSAKRLPPFESFEVISVISG